MPRRDMLVIDLGRRRVRALHARAGGPGLRVENVLVADIPSSIDSEDAEPLGRWIGEQLKKAGIPRIKATFAVSREHVGVKRLRLPTVEPDELPEMTRLSMQREINFDIDGAIVDYLPIDKTETTTIVLAMALPNQVMDLTRRVAAAAKIGIDRVSIRSMGVAALLQADGSALTNPTLTIDITRESVEFNVINEELLQFSRAADLHLDGPGQHHDEIADAVLTEAKRTWMSYRITEQAAEVNRALLLGDQQIASSISDSLQQTLAIDIELLTRHAMVDHGDHDMHSVWPLAGLMLRQIRGAATINFARPRRAPDRAAQQRMKALAGGGLAIFAIMAIAMYAFVDLTNLEQEADRLREEAGELQREIVYFQRDRDQEEHIWQWKEAEVDWLEHLKYLAELAPGRERLVLNTWTGVFEFGGVEWDRSSQEWSSSSAIRISVGGEARDRATADIFRESLVANELYRTSSSGADAQRGRRLPYGFTYTLRTSSGRPDADEESDDPDEEGDGSEGDEGESQQAADPDAATTDEGAGA